MTNHPNRNRDATARRLSALAARLYEAGGVPGAYVTLDEETREYRLVESVGVWFAYATAQECEAAIRDSARQFRADLRAALADNK